MDFAGIQKSRAMQTKSLVKIWSSGKKLLTTILKKERNQQNDKRQLLIYL